MMNTGKRIRSVWTLAAVAILALAIGQAQAITVDVPNGDFQTILKPGTAITATVPDGCYWSIPNFNIKGGGPATYGDGTTGNDVELPGWIEVDGTNADCMQGGGWGGPDGSGDIAFLCFASWGGPTTIQTAAPLSLPVSGTGYTLSADIYHGGGPVVLELLVDGVALTPDAASTPAMSNNTWVEFTRTYSTIPAGDVRILVGTRDDLGTGWTGNRASVDNVALNVDSIDPTLPDVDAGVDMVTWSGRAVQLDPNVVNNDTEVPQRPLSYAWSADPADGVEFDPNEFVEAPAVTITKATDNPSVLTLTLGVTLQGEEPVTDTMTIDVYDDACLAAEGIGMLVIDTTDLDENCITNFLDFALMAMTWLDDYTLTEPVPKP